MADTTARTSAPTLAVRPVGDWAGKVYGVSPVQRLARQVSELPSAPPDHVLVAAAAAVIGDSTLAWLIENPDHALLDRGGRPLAVVTPITRQERAVGLVERATADTDGFVLVDRTTMPDLFSRKLRRRQPMFARSLREESLRSIEWELFREVYKGVTDIVTRYVWPVPAFWMVRLLARIRITPNMVTLVGILLTVLTALWFAQSRFGIALAAAWGMTFLDTVDGKLARVTGTSSWWGNVLDHATDIVHPPAWWICLAVGLAAGWPEEAEAIWLSCAVILGTYLGGRAIEEVFKRRHGFNQYMWRRFDTRLRLVIARRNTILLLLTAGVLVGEPVAAFHAAALWSIVTIGVQAGRLVRADAIARRGGAIRSWLM